MNWLVTGAGGLIGSALVDRLLKQKSEQGGIGGVFVTGRNPAALQKRFDNYANAIGYDAEKPVAFDFHADVIVHAASPASPELFVDKPVETMMANIYGVKELLDYADRCKAKKFVYVSSSEVYGKAAPRAEGYKEYDYGFVDIGTSDDIFS